MIYEVEGDILLSSAQAIAHGIAPNDPMDKGLARSLHEKYPAMHKDFHHWCHQDHPKPGKAWIWRGVCGMRLVNLITQDGGYEHGSKPGKATLKHVRDCLKELTKIIKKESITSIAIPKIATGKGGLDWNDVKPLIDEKLGALDIPVYLYSTFAEGKKAQEATN
ncbi:MAG: macro domain-containing protein [Lentisphaeraceae bacterium]|nr:macro domain-containing protein [Lentisphaeraceae bacterium]